MEFLPAWASDLSGWGTVGILVLLIAMGRLVPKSALDRERENTKTWQDAWKTERAANLEKSEQVAELLEIGRTTEKVMGALQEAARDGGEVSP